ncbi:autophagy-related protein 23-like [Anneissia japonica]|uniref:autophagy-related protein 23-like n=1 Tax=Anneissia japonica TaxID=1529436 RepID=UPI0014258A46|nr:autophagy-related protein 23-like [Anneissia japonica]
MADVVTGFVSDEKLTIFRRSCQEGCQQLKVLSKFSGDDSEKNDCSTRKAKLALSKQEYSKLKPDSQTLQTKLQILDFLLNVNEENWPTLSAKDEEYSKVHEEKKKVNMDLVDMEDEILELVERAQEESTVLQDKISTMEQKLTSVESKKEKYEEIYKYHTECLAKCKLNSFNKSEKISDVLKRQEETLTCVEASLKKCTSSVITLRRTISHCQANLDQMKSTVTTGRKILQAISDENEEKRMKMVENTKWCEGYTSLSNKLFQVKENSFSGNSWSVDVKPYSNLENDKVTLIFNRNHNDPHQYSDVKIVSDTLDIRTTAEEAMKSNDISYLIQEIHKKFTSHMPLAKEINSLRQKFAIDFLQDENVLVCMLGSCGNIVCRLKIEQGYPSNGRISLQKITGQPEGTQPNCHPAMSNPTLTDWLDHLQQVLA